MFDVFSDAAPTGEVRRRAGDARCLRGQLRPRATTLDDHGAVALPPVGALGASRGHTAGARGGRGPRDAQATCRWSTACTRVRCFLLIIGMTMVMTSMIVMRLAVPMFEVAMLTALVDGRMADVSLVQETPLHH